MAHFAVICPEDAGHVISMGALGIELVRRGHRVTLVAGSKAKGLAGQLGLDLYELDTDQVASRFPPLLWLATTLCGAGWLASVRSWLYWRAELALRLVPPALQDLGVDGVVLDQTVSAGGTAAEHLGLPYVTVCSALLWHEEIGVPPPFTSWSLGGDPRALRRNRVGYGAWHWYMRPTLKLINRYRAKWKLPPYARIEDGYSSLAQISQLCPEFDFPRTQLPPTFHYIGSLAANRSGTSTDTFPWERLNGRPLMFASLGTVPDPANLRVFRRILAACAGLDAQLVLALGKWNDEGPSVREKLGPLPGDPLVVEFAPQLALLDRAALLITHGGVNTVLESLCRGVPIVALPRSGDQKGMGARVEYAGVGLRTSFQRGTPQELRGLVQRVLAEDVFRQRARHLQQALQQAGGASRAAEIAEQALLTRRPVPRP